MADRFGLTWFTTALKKFKRELALVLLASLSCRSSGLRRRFSSRSSSTRSWYTIVSRHDAVVVGLMAVNIFQALIEFLRTYLLSHTASRVDVELGPGSSITCCACQSHISRHVRRARTVARVRELDQIRQFYGAGADGRPRFRLRLRAGRHPLCLFAAAAFIVTLSIPVYVVIAIILQPILMRKTEERFNKGALSQQLLVETVLGMQTVKTSAASPGRGRLGRQACGLCPYLVQRYYRCSRRPEPDPVGRAHRAGYHLFLGAYQVIGGAMTVGALIAFNMIMGQITGPVLRLSSSGRIFSR